MNVKLNAKKKNKVKDYIENALITIWPAVGFCLFGLIPMVVSIYVSFTDLHVSDFSEAVWVGFDNFKKLFASEGYWTSYLNMLIYAINVPVCIGVGLFIAYLLNKITRGQRFMRTLFFIPYVCMVSVAVIPFRIIFDERNGVLNSILNVFGFNAVAWQSQNVWSFHFCLLLLTVWSGLGWVIIMLQAALGQVDESYYEAAMLDGATESQIFWKITFKAITPTISYLLTLKLIAAFQAMGEPYILGGNGYAVASWPNGTTAHTTTGVWLYIAAFVKPFDLGYGMASAGGWILAIIIFIVTRINMKLQDKWVSYDFA